MRLRFGPPLSHSGLDAVNAERSVLLDLVLPDTQHEPALSFQSRSMALVASHVALDLLPPVGRELFLPLVEVPAVPEVAVHEHDDAGAAEDNIGLARQVLDVLAKAQATRVHQLANRDFRLGVLAAHPRHRVAPLFGREVVSHDEGRMEELRTMEHPIELPALMLR